MKSGPYHLRVIGVFRGRFAFLRFELCALGVLL
jgi:hypothetical protein